jgi:SecD/SecF fusion protein
LGYSLYDTIIVFDRVRENIPRMPRAAFSQIVNRSMSEVMTRSIATTSCTLMPIIALLLFGGATLQDFAFALLIGVASGAYSSIFIASPVLTHWKERETVYRHRRHRIETELGRVPAYAGAAADVEPARERVRRRTGRITQPDPETLSAAEFEQLKRDIAEEEAEAGSHTSTLTKRLAHTTDQPAQTRTPPQTRKPPRAKPGRRAAEAPARTESAPSAPRTENAPTAKPAPDRAVEDGEGRAPSLGEDGGVTPAPDIAENEGMAHNPTPPSRPAKNRSRNRRHGRRR